MHHGRRIMPISELMKSGVRLQLSCARRGRHNVALFVAAGADGTAVEASNRCAMHSAARQRHVEAINSLVRVGGNCNQVTSVTEKGETPI